MLSPAQCQEWQTTGALLVSGLIPAELVQGVVGQAAAAQVTIQISDPAPAGLRFPHAKDVSLCNDVALHPGLLEAAAQLLGEPAGAIGLVLTQSLLVASTAAGAGDEAGLRRGLEENTLLAASPTGQHEAVHVMLFFDDSDEVGGATTVLDLATGKERAVRSQPGTALFIGMETRYRQGQPTVAAVGAGAAGGCDSAAVMQAAASMEAAREQSVLSSLTKVMEEAGLPLGPLDSLLSELEGTLTDAADILAALQTLVEQLATAGHDTTAVAQFAHGLTEQLEAMEVPAVDRSGSGSIRSGLSGTSVPGRRLVQHIILRRAAAEWVSNEAFIRSLAGHGPWLAQLSPTQRTVLGFPPPGHPFWLHPTALQQMVKRYPSMDPTDYLAAGAAPIRPPDYPSPGLPLTGAGSTTELAQFPPMADRLAFPEPVLPLSDDLSSPVLSPEHVAQFQNEGWALADPSTVVLLHTSTS